MSGESKKIEHSGTVVGVEGGVLKVEIINSSACGACSAAALCSAAEKRRKIVDVMPSGGVEYTPGDIVTFVGEESMGVKAVVLAYVVPLLLVVGGLMSAHVAGFGDAACAVAALAPLAPYYVILWLMRGRIDKTFIFKIKNQNQIL